ncbi:hypothetical protein [Helicobacter sp.]|uniref:hypothetical protein n=1 Tax=Helicobacter sp. TaxID=218 RepID=UPI002A90E254|nr:hypothetical protein [Helicobacter sp.]MDY5557395.1 hypothetical protein [Helicobacter sp.]
MRIFQNKKIIFITFLEILLCIVLGVGIALYANNNQKILHQQDLALHYVNISGKQRLLAQRIVFLGQMIATNYVLKRDNQRLLLEFEACIKELSTIHKTLQNFVVSTIVGKQANSTLDDVYFGGGNLMFSMENFLENASKIFYLNALQDVLIINQALLQQLEGDNGLLVRLELATFSQQIYAQNFLKEQEKNTEQFFYFGVFLCGLQALLLLWGFAQKL